jgi:hypothetical protein
MRARLQKYLPIVLIALAMQVLAPVAACWAAGAALADPLQNAAICHDAGTAGPGQGDRSGQPAPHGGTCSICCLAQASASLHAPQQVFATPFRFAVAVVWRTPTAPVIVAHRGSNANARAPPHAS